MKKILFFIIAMLMIISTIASARGMITDNQVQTYGTPENVDTTISSLDIMDKLNPYEDRSWLGKLFIQQQFFSSAKDLSTCKVSYTSQNMILKKGGLNENDKPYTSGAKCAVGDYIKWSVTNIPGKSSSSFNVPLFTDLWKKTSSEDLLVFRDYPQSSSTIFTKYKVNEVYNYYSCITCSAPELKSRCTFDADCDRPVSWTGTPYCSGKDIWQYKEKWACITKQNSLIKECVKGSENVERAVCQYGCDNAICQPYSYYHPSENHCTSDTTATCSDSTVIIKKKCINNQYVITNTLCPGKEPLKECTLDQTQECDDGTTIITKKCLNGFWLSTSDKCIPTDPTPPTNDCEDSYVNCPDGKAITTMTCINNVPTPVPNAACKQNVQSCIASAGYSWCEEKQKCLRTWEESCSIQPPIKPQWIKGIDNLYIILALIFIIIVGLILYQKNK